MTSVAIKCVNACRLPTPSATQLLAVFALVGILTGPVAAQPGDGPSRSGGFFNIGVQQLDATDLDQRLIGAGLPGVGSAALTLGGGGHAAVGRWRIGGEGHGLSGSRRDSDDGEFLIRAAGGYGLFTVGYDLVPGSWIEVVPSLGIGGGRVTADIQGRTAPTFDEILEDPRRGIQISRRSVLGSLGIGVRALVFPDGKGLVLGLRGGYLLPFAEGGWSPAGARVAGGPPFAAKGFHLQLTIGR